MDTVFMNSENNKTSDPNELLFNITDTINVNGSNKYVTLSNFSICYT